MTNIERLSPWGAADAEATFKSCPEDFRVVEKAKHEPVGEGEHVWLWVRKRDANTAWVADELAKQAGLKQRDVSYAGRKDRFAVTEQWFSLYDPKRVTDDKDFTIEGVEILKCIRHQQKLRIGQLHGNTFQIVLRDVKGDTSQLEERLKSIKTTGFPNYFGQQRFGHAGRNVQDALVWLEKGGKRISRNKQSIYLSALRSHLFNAVLSKRVIDGSWNRLLDGELAKLSGSNSTFLVEDVAVEQARCDAFDIDPTGPLFGKTKRDVASETKEVEGSVLRSYPEIVDFLVKKMDADRRSLRVLPEELLWEWEGNDLTLSFFLPKGSYATVLLEQIFKLN